MIETIVYNELLIAGYNVQVGTFHQVEKDKNGKSIVKTYEVDFVASKGIDRYYLQITDNIDKEATRNREINPFRLIKNSDRKYLLVNRPISQMRLEDGVILCGLVDFILDL